MSQSQSQKIFQIAIFIIFALMTTVQLNDPDPIFWIAFYGSCAVLPVIAFFKIYNPILFYLCLAFSAVAMFLTFNGVLEYTSQPVLEPIMQKMSAEKPYIEETREFFGAFIALLLISALHFFFINRKAQ